MFDNIKIAKVQNNRKIWISTRYIELAKYSLFKQK